jgi:hypothetical protein
MSGRPLGARRKIPLNHHLETAQYRIIDSEFPIEIVAHFAFHMIDLPDDTPRFIRVSVVADDLGDNHERGDEEAVAGRAVRGVETRF